jgi:hypothetical protein
MKTKAEKTHTSKPQLSRQASQSGRRDTGFFIPPSVQTKLAINKPGDPLEREADSMADRVVSSKAQPKQEEPENLQLRPQMVGEELQRQIETQEEEEIVNGQEEPKKEELQRQCADCEQEEHIQRSTTGEGSSSNVAPPIVNRVVSGGGDPLESGTRNFMENRFSSDFSKVRVHKDSQAQLSAKAISAQAYTYGPHIVFARGKYQPHTSGGSHLLAHELTHVVQQDQTVRRFLTKNQATPSGNFSHLPRQSTAEEPSPLTPEKDKNTSELSATELPPEGLAMAEVSVGSRTPTAEVEPLMPSPPAELGEAANARLRQVQGNARKAAENNASLPTADESTQEAREGVTEPNEETSARASGHLTATLAERPAPSPDIEKLCENIRRVIREKRPPDEESLLKTDPEEAAKEAGTQLNNNIESNVDGVEGQYDELDENPTGQALQIGEPVEVPPELVVSTDINAAEAAPDPLTEEEVTLDYDVEASTTQLEEAGMRSEVAEVIQEGPIAEARAAQGELEQTASEDPAVVLAEQDAALSSSRDDMEALQDQALAALEASRRRTIGNSNAQQLSMVGNEEEQRQALGRQAESIFSATQEQVNLLLGPLTRTAMEMWESGKKRIATEFEQHLARVQRWVDDRHSGFGGGVVELWDNLTGLPSWVPNEYNDAERRFGNSICALIREISTYVNGVIFTCEELIGNANREIDELFSNAPEELQEWAAEQREIFQQRLDGLHEQVHSTQKSFNEDLTNRAAQAVQEVRERVHALREAARSLLGRISNAITEFLKDPLRAIINGLLSVVGIDPSAFWALISRIGDVISDIANDPLRLASNLLLAIRSGFQRFFDNILTHLYENFIKWLFSGLGEVGVEVPQDFSLKGIVTFFLQLMGITWQRIRNLLARHIGEENVALLEQAIGIVSNLIKLGPTGIFELVKDKLDPSRFLNEIIQKAINFIKETLITKAAIRILGLFNPIGAIAQAIEAIYKVLKWIFENAARIFSLVETVVNGMVDIIAGNITAMATAVENSLVRLLVPVIDFIANFIGLGDLPKKVTESVRGLQNWVEGILDRVIGWLADKARKILSAMGITEDEDPEEVEEAAEELNNMEVGEEMTFSAKEKGHRFWVDTAGSGVEVMVNSNPMTIEERLTEWNDRLNELPNEQQGEASNLINQARNQYELVLQEGVEAKDAILDAQENPTQEVVLQAERENEEVVSAQQALKITLAQLFELFGENEINFSLIRGGFTTETNDPHEIYFEKLDGIYELLIASGQSKTYQAFLNSITVDASLPNKVAAKNELINLLAQLETLRNGEDKEEDIENIVTQMLEKTRLLFESERSSIPQWSALNTAGYGTKMTIEYLTGKAPPGLTGSTPTYTTHPYYDIINQRRKGHGPYYVRGHLLSEKLFGPGMWYNLSPLTNFANTQGHEKMVESHLKSGITEVSPGFRIKRAFRYEVEPQYGRGVNQGLINQIKNSTEPIPDVKTKESIVRGEAYVPKGFKISAEELNPLNQQPIGTMAFPDVANVIDQSSPSAYQINAVNISYPIKISNAKKGDLQILFSDNIANQIEALMIDDRKKPIGDREITNFKVLAERVLYLRENRLKKLNEENKIVW